METAVTIALIAATPPTLVALLSLYQTFQNHKANVAALHRVATTVDTVVNKVDDIQTVAAETRVAHSNEATTLCDEIEQLKARLRKLEKFQ